MSWLVGVASAGSLCAILVSLFSTSVIGNDISFLQDEVTVGMKDFRKIQQTPGYNSGSNYWKRAAPHKPGAKEDRKIVSKRAAPHKPGAKEDRKIVSKRAAPHKPGAKEDRKIVSKRAAPHKPGAKEDRKIVSKRAAPLKPGSK